MAGGDNLLEAVTLDTIAHATKRAAKHSLPPGAPCPNCQTTLAGPWCHACGQRAEKFDRSIWRLAGEALEGIFEFDGRIWQTLPRLVLAPGRLTRSYLDGHRAPQLPPFRLFLIVLLLVFFAGSLAVGRSGQDFKVGDLNSPGLGKGMSPKDKAEFDKDMAQMRTELATNPLTAAAQTAKARTAAANAAAGKPAGEPNIDVNLDGKNSPRSIWLRGQLAKATKNPQSFFFAMEEWGHRFAILMLPLAALMLTGLFAFRKGVYVFDHVIFSMHSLSFVGLLLSVMFIGSIWLDAIWWLTWAAPVHLFVHMRGTYRTSVVGTLWRMWWLFLGTTIVVALLMVGLVFVGLAEAR